MTRLVTRVLIIYSIVFLPLMSQPYISNGGQTWQDNWPICLKNSRIWVEGLDSHGAIIQKEQQLRWAGGPLALGWGAIWGIGKTEKAPYPIYKKVTDETWQLVAKLQDNHLPNSFLMLSDDCLIAMSKNPYAEPFELNSGASPLAIFKRANEKFVLDSLVTLIDGGLIVKAGNLNKEQKPDVAPTQAGSNSYPRPNGSSPSTDAGLSPSWAPRKGLNAFIFQMLVGGIQFVPVPGGGILISLRTGHVWVFGPLGALNFHISVFEEIKETDFPDMLTWDPVILGAVPTPDGEVILATRSRNGVVEGSKKYPTLEKNPISGKWQNITNFELAQRNRTAAREHYQELWWWHLDPKAGKLYRQSVPPVGAPEVLLPEKADVWDSEGMGLYLGHDLTLSVDHLEK